MDENVCIKQYAQIYPADTQTPISLYLSLVREDQGLLLESAEVDGRLGRYSLLAWDFRLELTCYRSKMQCRVYDRRLQYLSHYCGEDFHPALKEVLSRINIIEPDNLTGLHPISRSLIGYFGYEFSSVLEPKLYQALSRKQTQAVLVLPGKQILFDHLYHRCIFISLDEDFTPPAAKPVNSRHLEKVRLGTVSSSVNKEQYCSQVAATRKLIQAGEAIQVVLSSKFSAAFSGSPLTLYRRLRQVNPSPYMFYLNLPDIKLLGSSPELLVRCTKGVLEERPIAGTRRRGMNAGQDEQLASELFNDPKEQAEHVMLVDLGRNDLGRIAVPGSVKMEKFMQVELYSHVMHLTSYLRAELKPVLDCVDVLGATFPAGTVTGAPKIRAMEIIADMEPLDRGPYAGAVGWLGLDSQTVNLDTGIIIRSMWLAGGKLNWQTGAGIVSDSEPVKEWEECLNKAQVLQYILSQKGGNDAFAH